MKYQFYICVLWCVVNRVAVFYWLFKYNYLQFTKEGDLIKEWGSVREILKANPTYKRSGVNSAASGYKKSYMGFIWKKGPKNHAD